MAPLLPIGLFLACLAGTMTAMPNHSHAQTKAAATAIRPVTWGVAVAVPGVPNLHRVTPTFYRSAQPLKVGFSAIGNAVGIKTVISLRAFHSDKKMSAGTGLTLISIPINTWNIKQTDLVRALAALEVAGRLGPVLLHCQHGADRTGLVAALHRMLNEGWTREAALDEMRNGQFGYHAVWGNIPAFIERVDIEAMRREVAVAVCKLEPKSGAVCANT